MGEIMEPALDLQKALRARLVGASVVTSLVPASAILDRNARPAPFPSIIIGEGQTTPDDGIARNRHMVFADLHIWATETGTVVSKQIAGAIRAALNDGRLTLDHHRVVDLRILSTRFMRDPDGLHSHGVVSVEARLMEVA